MEQKEVIELLTIFDQSTLTEFHLKDGHLELYLNKNTVSKNPITNNPPATVATPVVPVAVQAEAQTVTTSEVALVEATKEAVVSGKEIVSPLVGVAYLKPAPDKPNFKEVGDHVTKGEVVCIVEAMKVMNEITSDVTGEVVAVLVENEAIVEFNQPLFRVKEG
ncbi:acetyl-CoA carboxylase biotin carboxyl carrier protein [Enterococcus lemanii]|uniref:Biotin carboxyl carrier protein of acetyl-CoA carboxylase n=1 Tax=Enterococcus lemanii TaxID=1159752 RepID=A0ABV9MXG8_9ENTE|nr:acetyl-CoA carboxylase biotin carboxyl carrier protein [Enterococcus lemanii]MBM7710376.1 acetyl-CoA carboxylase biotin carboxyl carrier protein [Enterococcus lemanii]